MEKSIETIWKGGFLDSNALVAPQVNDLYNRKSEHIIEKFKRMFRLNLKAIAFGGVIGCVGLFSLQLPLTGIVMFLTLLVIFIVNQKELNGLGKIDQSVSSYDYLKSFDLWMKGQLSLNARMARFYYPGIFLGMTLGIWFSVHGPRLYEKLAGLPESGWLINGIPAVLMIPILLIASLLGIFGDGLYRMELNAVYGRVLDKLDELLTDMERLRQG
jgi:hypothetical protein